MTTVVQSVLVPKAKFTEHQAISWVKQHFKVKKYNDDQRINFYSFRQLEPTYLKQKGYTHYIEKRLKNAVLLVVALNDKRLM